MDQNIGKKKLDDEQLDRVSGGTGHDFEEENKPLEVDLPWWWKQNSENQDDPGDNDSIQYF